MLLISQSSSITGTSILDCLVSYPEHLWGGGVTLLQRCSRCILQHQLVKLRSWNYFQILVFETKTVFRIDALIVPSSKLWNNYSPTHTRALTHTHIHTHTHTHTYIYKLSMFLYIYIYIYITLFAMFIKSCSTSQNKSLRQKEK